MRGLVVFCLVALFCVVFFVCFVVVVDFLGFVLGGGVTGVGHRERKKGCIQLHI